MRAPVYVILKTSLYDANSHRHIKKKKFPANIYLFKVNNMITRKMSEICSDLTIDALELFLLFLFFLLNNFHSYCC